MEKTMLVTGANAGIGKATALGLAKMDAAVVMVCRNREKGEAARDEIIAQSGNENVDLMIADLSAQQSIRRLAQEFNEKYERLDVLVNNAGGVFSSRTLTEDGLEYTFAFNHLGYFLLTNLLLDKLKANGAARIVNVSSEAQAGATINFDDLQSEQDYNGFRAYGQSKLANVLFTNELARRLDGNGVTVNALHPGVVRTNFGKGTTSFPFNLMIRLLAPFLASPEKGARTSIYLATSPKAEGVTGKYFVDEKEKESNPISHDAAVAQRLWQVSEQLTGLAQ
ncbi:MAG: SDR family oxidoreductase [Chloroflexi bacterium]|nr:SDR family oxidoreductase [Chloroflexota bacterium]